MFAASSLTALLILWAAVTTVLVLLLVYRSVIGMKEEDQLFLDPSQASLEADQKAIMNKLARVAPYTKALSILSGVLLLAIAGLWIYKGIQGVDAG
jgi:hypothetical protein